MAKFKSLVLEKDTKNRHGEVLKSGRMVWIPLDDTALLEPISQTAFDLGFIKNEKGDAMTVEEFEAKKKAIKENFARLQIQDAKRRKVY